MLSILFNMEICGAAHRLLCQNSLLTLPISCNTYPTWHISYTLTKEDLKNNASIFSAEIRKKNPEKILYWETKKNNSFVLFLFLLTFIEPLKIVLINVIAISMMLSNCILQTFLKQRHFKKKVITLFSLSMRSPT